MTMVMLDVTLGQGLHPGSLHLFYLHSPKLLLLTPDAYNTEESGWGMDF